MQLWLAFGILGVTILLFISNRVRADLVALIALLAFVLTGILSPTEALAGFSNTVVIMIAGLFVVGAGILRTGLAQQAGNVLLKYSGNSEMKLFILLLVIVAFVGAFMSNTGTVAILLPIVMSIALSTNRNPSQYLIPLSYMASFSGLLTLIASPPNLIVNQILIDNGFHRLGFFEITPIGVVGVVSGIIYLSIVRKRLLPNENNRGNSNHTHSLSPKQLAKDYQLGGQLIRMKVPETSKMVQQRLAQLKIPANYELCILKIERKSTDGIYFLPMTYHEMAGPSSVIQPKDILYIQGNYNQAQRMANDFGLLIESDQSEATELISKQLGIAEVLLTPNSKLINETVRTIGFREKYNLNILGVNRRGEYVITEMSKVRLRFGDALLVQGAWDDIELLSKETQDVVVIGQPKEHASMASANGKAPIAAAILVFMITLMVLELFPAVISVSIGAILMIVTGCVRNMDDAYGNINWESVILIGAMLPVATALEKTGGMEFLSTGIVELFESLGPLGVLGGIFFITMVFGQFISNTATAVLFAPIAMNAAIGMEVSPYPFLIAVAVGASMSFSTPVATPTNALVMTAGGYTFGDFAKVGIPLQIVMFIIMMIAIPIFFPL